MQTTSSPPLNCLHLCIQVGLLILGLNWRYLFTREDRTAIYNSEQYTETYVIISLVLQFDVGQDQNYRVQMKAHRVQITLVYPWFSSVEYRRQATDSCFEKIVSKFRQSHFGARGRRDGACIIIYSYSTEASQAVSYSCIFEYIQN